MVKSSIPRTTANRFPEKIIFLFGPTGVGKTDLLLSLDPGRYAVINADSIQVYRSLDIGSAKAPIEIRRRIEHRLIDVEDPWNQFTVGKFLSLADEACREIAEEGKIPLLCGGTAYYFKHFLHGLPVSPECDGRVREKVASLVREKGLPWLYDELGRVDPVSQARIKAGDAYRVRRAMEVYYQSGRPLSDFPIPTSNRGGMKPLVIGLRRESDELKKRIALRVDTMFREGLVEEVRSLVESGARSTWPGMMGIGYKEFFDVMKSGEGSLSSVREEIARNSILYAKRQMTFFRSFSSVTWIAPDRSLFLPLVSEYCSS